MFEKWHLYKNALDNFWMIRNETVNMLLINQIITYSNHFINIHAIVIINNAY